MDTKIVKTIRDGKAKIEISKIGNGMWYDYKLTIGRKSRTARGFARVWTAKRSAETFLSNIRAGKTKI